MIPHIQLVRVARSWQPFQATGYRLQATGYKLLSTSGQMSEREPQTDLTRSRRRDAPNQPELRRRDSRVRVVVLPPVERVERFKTNLKLRPAQVERLRNRHVDATTAWSPYLRGILITRPHSGPGNR